MSRRSLLLVAQLAPPSPLIAARRVGALTKYLARLGVEVTVLTSAISGHGTLEGAIRVVRTRDLLATPLNWRRKQFAAVSGATQRTYGRPSRLQSVIVPDPAVVSWLPFALLAALGLARRQRFDCVVTTSPPQSSHAVGRALRARGVRWIAELRDGWTYEPPRAEWPLAAQRALDRALERRLLQAADAIVGVTQPLVDDAAARFGVETRLITNGFDPEEIVDVRDDELLDTTKHSFVYTGRIGVADRQVTPLLEALRRLRLDEPSLAARIEVVFAGALTADEAEMLLDPRLAGLVRSVGPLGRRRALALQRAADSLLVLTRGARSEATGKLFEYLATGKPILVLGEKTAAARIVGETKSGRAAPFEPTAIADQLRRFVTEPLTPPDPKVLVDYAYPSIARQYAELVEHVCGAD